MEIKTLNCIPHCSMTSPIALLILTQTLINASLAFVCDGRVLYRFLAQEVTMLAPCSSRKAGYLRNDGPEETELSGSVPLSAFLLLELESQLWEECRSCHMIVLRHQACHTFQQCYTRRGFPRHEYRLRVTQMLQYSNEYKCICGISSIRDSDP